MHVLKVARPTEEYSWVRNWSYNFDGYPGQLHARGEIEQEQLGKRIGLHFSELLAEDYEPSAYTFVSSQVIFSSQSIFLQVIWLRSITGWNRLRQSSQ